MSLQDSMLTNPVSLPHPNSLLIIEELDYSNPYDFHTSHRHNYFEIILVKGGEGLQYIDTTAYEMKAGQLFAIYPGQIHLLHRNTAQGLIIQFRKDIFEFIHPVKHHDLYFKQQSAHPDSGTFSHLFDLAVRIQELLRTKDLSMLAIHKAYSYLQIILITISELYPQRIVCHGQPLIDQFLLLITQHIRSKRKVSDYSVMLGCSLDKLNLTCKSCFAKTPLELIHEELLLEIRRLLLLNQMSLKEIAYELNFDSPANFSGFIKLRTGMTPSELQASILQIYK